METSLTYYAAILALIVIGILVAKKVAGCLIKTVITIVLVALGVAIYYFYLR